MDTGTTGVAPLSNDDATRAAEIEKEIESIRGNLDGLVSELDHRRHRMSPVRIAREHPMLASMVGSVVLAGLTTVGVLMFRARARQQRSWIARGRRLSATIGHLMAAKPVETSPGIGWKVLTAAGTATAAVAGRRLARRLFWPGQGS